MLTLPWQNLVWSGAGESGPKIAHAPHTCPYKGKTHLCFFEGEQHQGFARGHGTIMNQHYRIVKTIDSSGAGASNDMHEFRMTPHSNGTTVLMTIYQPRTYDLTTNPSFKIKNGMGWIVEGVFQEVDIETGRVVFEWRSLDHVDPSVSYIYPGTTDTSGDGLAEDTPWDYFHINSIDKNEDGDYLISARHTSSIYKLSGVDGHILWQLGGVNATFEQVNFNFSSQHHARWVSENGTHTVMSLFDNASNGNVDTNKWSHGFLVAMNHVDNTATMIKKWGAPEQEGGILSGSQGNMQLLPGGNIHIGWGEHAYFSEHTSDGLAVMYGVLAQRPSNVMIYRSYKFNWTGMPVTKPALWTFSRTGDNISGMVLYVSWNGATEVRSWNLYGGESASGPFHLVANVKKTGFETTMQSKKVTMWAFAEALDGHGRPLERSVIARTFVPSTTLRPYCNDWACGQAEKDEDGLPAGGHAEVKQELLSTNRGFNTRNYYAELPTAGAEKTRLTTFAVVVIVGLIVTLTLAAIAALYRRGRLPGGMQHKAEDLQDFFVHSSLGSKLGKYTRLSSDESKGLS